MIGRNGRCGGAYTPDMDTVVQFRGEVGAAHPIASVDNALMVIQLLIEKPTLRVMDVADRLGVARSTAHRVLSALLARGFVVQDARKVYHRGPFFDLLASGGGAPRDIRPALRPLLIELSESVGETVHLGVLEGNGARFIDGVPSAKPLRVGVRTGMLLPAHRTSIGKALLAELPAESVRSLYPRGFDGKTERLSEARDEFEREIATVRRKGYARNIGESDSRVTAIGTCIRDSSGRAVAAVAIAIPRARFEDSMLAPLVARLRSTAADAAESISTNIAVA